MKSLARKYWILHDYKIVTLTSTPWHLTSQFEQRRRTSWKVPVRWGRTSLIWTVSSSGRTRYSTRSGIVVGCEIIPSQHFLYIAWLAFITQNSRIPWPAYHLSKWDTGVNFRGNIIRPNWMADNCEAILRQKNRISSWFHDGNWTKLAFKITNDINLLLRSKVIVYNFRALKVCYNKRPTTTKIRKTRPIFINHIFLS